MVQGLLAAPLRPAAGGLTFRCPATRLPMSFPRMLRDVSRASALLNALYQWLDLWSPRGSGGATTVAKRS